MRNADYPPQFTDDDEEQQDAGYEVDFGESEINIPKYPTKREKDGRERDKDGNEKKGREEDRAKIEQVRESILDLDVDVEQEHARQMSAEKRRGRQIQEEVEKKYLPKEVEDRNFEFIEKLGEGGMGVVYLAHELKFEDKKAIREKDKKIYGQDVVIKVMSPTLLEDEKKKKKFDQEIENHVIANDDPYVVSVNDVVDVVTSSGETTKGLVMEYIRGGDFSDKIAEMHKEGRGLTPKMKSDIAKSIIEVCNAVQSLHDKGLLHRDIKPENIFVGENFVKLGDFGIVKALEKSGVDLVPSEQAETGEAKEEYAVRPTAPGTIDFIPPEAFRNAPPNEGFDLYAIGGVLYEALTNKAPVPDASKPIFAKIVEKVDKDVPTVKEVFGKKYKATALDEMTTVLLDRDPEKRKEFKYEGEVYKLDSARNIAESIKILMQKEEKKRNRPSILKRIKKLFK